MASNAKPNLRIGMVMFISLLHNLKGDYTVSNYLNTIYKQGKQKHCTECFNIIFQY